MTTRRTPQDTQLGLFDTDPAQEPPQAHRMPQEPHESPEAPPVVTASYSDAERDRRSYEALVQYI